MADESEKSGQEPNLELPSLLSFGRKRKRRSGEPAQDGPATEPIAAEEPVAEVPPEDSAPLAADPVVAPPSEPRGGLAPSTDKAKRLPPVPPPTAHPDAPAQQIPVPPPPPPPPDEPQEVEDPPVVAAPEMVEDTTVLPIEDPDPGPAEPVEAHHETPAEAPANAPAADHVDESPSPALEEPAGEQRPVRGGTSLTLPAMSPRAAAAVTGALTGLLGVLLAYFASRGCETVRGVGSCGGIGLLALLLIVAIQVVLGAILLRAWQLSDPTSTSFLGVGLVAVFVLLFLLSSLESVWMLLVIPVLSALTFVLSWWVTTTFVEVPGSDEARR